MSENVKNKLPYAKSFFPQEGRGRHGDVVVGENYTQETLNYMTPFSGASSLAHTIAEVIGANMVVDACAGIGGNTLGFVSESKITKVIAYEIERERWVMLKNNLSQFDPLDKTSAFNQSFDIGEDLRLLDIHNQAPESTTVVYFDPPWLPSGKTIDPSNYLLANIRVSGKSLEEWCVELCQHQGYLAVVMHLPLAYKLVLPGQIEEKTKKGKLVYYTLNSEVTAAILSALSVVQQDKPVIEKKEAKIYSHEKDLDVIPQPQLVKKPGLALQTYLTDNFPRLQYVRDHPNPKSIHLGQRKLLLSEVEFLTRVLKYRPGEYTLLYIGAAPGIHIPVLSEMFPEIKFILYDGAPFRIKATNRIELHSQLFTDDLVATYSSVPNLLFISDIRSAPNKMNDANQPDEGFEKEVSRNMEQQRKWVEGLRPKRSLLKFRLPFISPRPSTEYFDGILFFQAYAPAFSTECRLEVGPDAKMVAYDHKRHEQQMFYFNTKYRVQPFTNYSYRYGWSYDTIREYFILKRYMALRGRGDHEIETYSNKFDSMTGMQDKKIMAILYRQSGS